MPMLRAESRLLAAALLAFVGCGAAQSPAAVIDAPEEERCKALASHDFSRITDAPTIIRSSALVASKDGVPAYCRVQGDVTAQIEIDVRLPAHDWNGKFLAIANVVNDAECDGYLKRGYACMPVFRNFKKGRQDPEWAAARLNDLNTRLEANIGSHLLTLAGKAITSQYYAKPPQRAYFMGCSAGGHSAMLQVQRFPWDYDGIVAGAPNLDTSEWVVRALWSAKNWRDNDNKPALSTEDLGILHRAVLDACDRDDGVEDGIVGNPVGCRFNPSSLLCTAGKQGACLTAPKVAAIDRIYSGPPMPLSGLAKPTPNMLPGSELLWGDLIRNAQLSEAMMRDKVAPYFKLIFERTHPELTPANFDFERDYRRGHPTFIAVDNPDLRKFKSAGGKLMAYLGTNDMAYVNGIVDYYETVERTMGGRAATQDFFRFYMVPGMNHCGGGVGAGAIDYLSYLEAWVEESKAPDVLIGAHIDAERYAREFPRRYAPLEFPLVDSVPITFKRPVYPYPLYAKYKGSGDPNDAANFAPIAPLPDSAVASTAPASKDRVACEGQAGRSLPHGQILSTQLVPAGKFQAPDGQSYDVPTFCRIQGVARPTSDSQINFEVWLPAGGKWNGRYYQHGQGGGGGSIAYGALASFVRNGAVGAATDDGHVRKDIAEPWNAFALHHPQKIIDVGYRALGETTVSAKKLIRDYYGRPPQYSYFEGCSGGGGYAMTAAQRFPQEWDGILAGAPSNNGMGLFAASTWNTLAWLDPKGRISPQNLPAIQKAVLASCTPQAYVLNGIPADPRFCRFDPTVLACKGAQTDECLTAPQIATLQKIYRGPHNPRTDEQIYPGFPPASESGLIEILNRVTKRGLGSTYKYFVFDDPQWDVRTFNFDSDIDLADNKMIAGESLKSIWNATNPDLSPLRNKGAKVLMYFGWNDAALTPVEGIAYYEKVARTMGGIDKTRDFYRLFMVPGMAHCEGGPGANAFGQRPYYPVDWDWQRALKNDADHDIMRALEAWVETGRKPDRIVAARYVDGNPKKGVAFTRPLCPYPEIAIYGGAGSLDEASSFQCKTLAASQPQSIRASHVSSH